eukprot:CAMPEP_0115176958 /NCGR_PEP_ID=MMETSP0270-20121206/5135_1 /TAXON_ID=71861 /ORGANISM="Scrippsiella trochoidea, Strain CCMP3099" /LENGTH=49 /DNA_ID=CAMNT_0002589869 /DNA_START=150 /DNA_END=299 /DNA_ORIENTATION=+
MESEREEPQIPAIQASRIVADVSQVMGNLSRHVMIPFECGNGLPTAAPL